MNRGWTMGAAGALGAVMALGAVTALGGMMLADAAQAQDMPRRYGAAPRPVRVAARPGGLRPLTVHRRVARVAPGPRLAGYGYGYEGGYAGPGLVRRWNDPNLDSFGGWRLGGDNFYGDGRGNPITRGNATLGMISGYGGARGGYGGPHFDSVGGFHNGPGPDAQESEDYASGSISRPDYGGIVPHYPSLKQRVAALNTGIPLRYGPAPITRAAYAGAATPAAYRASADPVEPAGDRPASPADMFPGFGLMDDGSF